MKFIYTETSYERIAADVQKLIADKLGYSNTQVHPNSDLRNELGMDSLDMAEIQFALEDDYEILVDDEELDVINTIDDVARLVAGKVGVSA